MEPDEKLENRLPCDILCSKDQMAIKNLSFSNDNRDNIKLLEHIASCDICSHYFTESIETSSLIKAPRYMKSNIIEQCKTLQETTKSESFFEKQYTKRLRLFQYSFKVGLAMCGALLLLFSTSAYRFSSTEGQTNVNSNTNRQNRPLSTFTIKINNNLRDFSNSIVEQADTLVSNNKIVEEDKNDK